MKTLSKIILFAAGLAVAAPGQDKLNVSGTPIPQSLLEQNYGKMPKGISGYDLSICNTSDQKQTLLSSQIYQALVQANVSITPVGRQIMLASILRNQNSSWSTLLGVGVSSATQLSALLATSKSVSLPASAMTALGLTSLLLGQVKPVLAPDKVEKFDREVLEAVMILDAGSCAERTVFALTNNSKAKARSSVRFRVP